MSVTGAAELKEQRASTSVLDIRQVLEQQRIGSFQVMLAVLLIGCMYLDGLSAQAMGFAAPAIIRAWHVPRHAFGVVFGAGNFGLMLGAIIMGYFGDWIGRKRAIVIGALFLCAASLLNMTATSVDGLILFRFLSGLGVGGILPNTVVLGTEYAPRRYHARCIWVLFLGYTSGAATGALIVAQLFPRFGWQSIFFIAGILPVVVALLVALYVPESVRFLSLRSDKRDEIAKILRKIDRNVAIEPGTRLILQQERHAASLKHLFIDGRAMMTSLIWVALASSLMTMMFLLNWLPTVLESPKIPRNMAAADVVMLQVGGILGGLAISYCMDKFGPRVLAVTYALAIPFVGLIGLGGEKSPILLLILTFGAGCCIIGGNTNINAVASKMYPTFIRSNGVGWANSVGRIGSIFGPVIGGMLLTLDLPLTKLFWFAALPPFVTAIAFFWLSRLYATNAPGAKNDAGAPESKSNANAIGSIGS